MLTSICGEYHIPGWRHGSILSEGQREPIPVCWGEFWFPLGLREEIAFYLPSEGRDRSRIDAFYGKTLGLRPGPSSPQNLDDALRDLSAAMHRDLSEKQALCYALSFPPTKLELCATRPEGTDSFIFEFPHPDARLGFEQAFDEAKRKLGEPGPCWCSPRTSRQCLTSEATNPETAVFNQLTGRVD
jgi:hypothetical protein